MEDYTEQYDPIDFDFKAWVLEQQDPRYTIAHNTPRCIELQTDYATMYIRFYDLGIVEISIVSNKDQVDHYNLHFQLNDERHAKKLFWEMTGALFTLEAQREVNVLLSCSGGLTSSYFAEKLNAEAKERGLRMHFHAVGASSIYEEAPHYDLVLLAPQIGYLQKNLQGAFPDKTVSMIPTAMFASFDAPSALKFIHDELLSAYTQRKEAGEASAPKVVHEGQTAIVGIMIDRDRVRQFSRVYDQGRILLDEVTVKPIADWQDTDDILDTILARFPEVERIGIATPGVVTDGRYVEAPISHHIILRTYKDHVEKKYQRPCSIANNCNASAVGFHLHHPQYHHIVYHSQPYGSPAGGQGYIVNDRLIEGTHGQSGEYSFFFHRMQFSDEPRELAKTDQGMFELVTKALLPALSILGPEAVAIRSSMTNDMAALKQQVSHYIPEEYLPDFIYVDDPRDYLLDGMLALCKQQDPSQAASSSGSH